MSLLFVRPGVSMAVGNGRRALCAPLSTSATVIGPGLNSPSLIDLLPAASGWWDASTPAGLLGVNAQPVAVWNEAGAAMADLSGNGRNLQPFFGQSVSGSPQGVPHLSGLLGGVGYPVNGSGLLQPALNPDAGWSVPSSVASSPSAWTWYLVWSRPNWRQGSGRDAEPATLLAIGSQPVLQIDSNAGTGRLILFPRAQAIVLSTAITRRHTHSIILRYDPTVGLDVWLDDNLVAQGIAWTFSAATSQTVLLHDSTARGAAQCWLHEAAEWGWSLLDSQIVTLLAYANRWTRGMRRGIFLVFNGQSNAINYSLNDGAAALLAQGIAWHIGALAYNVLATEGSPTSYTMQSGHGIYVVANDGYPYPGSFVTNPGDGSAPSEWSLGADGTAVQTAIGAMAAEDLADVCAMIWPWNETDSLRGYGELQTFQAAASRFLLLVRVMLGDTANRIPLIWWNAIPYGATPGISMHRQAVLAIAADPHQHVVIGNPQTSDSNARESSWDATTGLSTGGDSAHRDAADNLRFAKLASPIVARAMVAGGLFDSIAAIPDALPKVGGPSIVHVYKQTSSSLVVTIVHDAGTDLRIPLQAVSGAGFSVMDGGSLSAPGSIVGAVACLRLDATHLQLELGAALSNVSARCMLFYPFGPAQIGRGNAVTDNYSTLSKPAGWDASGDLGPDWALDFPLAATFAGIPLSDQPA